MNNGAVNEQHDFIDGALIRNFCQQRNNLLCFDFMIAAYRFYFAFNIFGFGGDAANLLI